MKTIDSKIQQAKAIFFQAVRDNQVEIARAACDFLIGQVTGISADDRAVLAYWSTHHGR